MGLGNVGSNSVITGIPGVDAPVGKTTISKGAQKATGIDSLTADFGPNQYTSVVAQLTGIGAGGVAQGVQLSPQGRTDLALIGLGIRNGAMSSEMQSRWGAFVADHAADGGAVDPNALVQEVLRESYLQTTEDLRFFAEKVKFYNNLKKAIRDELTKARNVDAQNAKLKDGDPLGTGAYPQVTFDGTYYGPTTEQTQALTQSGGVADTSQLSGKGLEPYNGTPPLDPAPAEPCSKWVTAGGYVVTFNPDACETNIYKSGGPGEPAKQIDKIWGDPHVIEGKRGDAGDGIGTWSFGNDSTFILPDGTKVCLNTEETSKGSGIYVTKGIDVLSGTSHGAAGIGPDGTNRGNSSVTTDDRIAFDAANADAKAKDNSAGVFFVQADGTCFKTNPDGSANEVAVKDWEAYTADKSVVTGQGTTTGTADQQAALMDGASISGATKTCNTKAELQTYIKDLETKLDSVGDDAQLANVDLQNILQKQQQTLQMMSNISKMLNDTALAIIRKISG
jgi:hypothetical protein